MAMKYSKKSFSKYTPEFKRFICYLLKQGYTVSAIHQDYGISRQTVLRWKKLHEEHEVKQITSDYGFLIQEYMQLKRLARLVFFELQERKAVSNYLYNCLKAYLFSRQ